MKLLALLLFILMYVLMIIIKDKREYIAFFVSIVFIIFGIVPLNQIIPSIDFNVILMMSGTMILVYYFIDSKMPAKIADFLLDISPSVKWVTILLSAFAGLISAFIDNTATVLMIAPIGLAVSKRLKLNPIPIVISIAVSSNLQGAATLVGDATSIMLGAYANLNFNNFFILDNKPSIFFAVEFGAIASLMMLFFLFRNQNEKVEASRNVRVTSKIPSIALIVLVISLIIASFIPNTSSLINGIICITIALTVMFIDTIETRKPNRILEDLKEVDYSTLILLASLFIVIDGIKNVGIINDIANIIVNFSSNNTFLLYTIIVWGSAILSGFIDNIPYVATMLPIVASVSSSLHINPYLLYFGLLSGATLGGNLTPFGASANIAACGLLKKDGYDVSFKDFSKIGIPLTLAALITSYIFVWFIWS